MPASVTSTISVSRFECAPLPPRLKVLYVAGPRRIGSTLAEGLAAECNSQVFLEEAMGTGAGMTRLQDEAFDIVLAGYEKEELDALAMAAGLAAMGGEDPVIVLGKEPVHQMLAPCLAAGAEGYLTLSAATVEVLEWTIARALERTTLVRGQRRMEDAERTRQEQEQEEAQRRLQDQRAAVAAMQGVPIAPLPSQIASYYRELLQAYIVMGSGNLTEEIQRLVGWLVDANASPSQAMHWHLHIVEKMVQSLGSRSTRHVLARADLLALELNVKLGEVYRSRRAV